MTPKITGREYVLRRKGVSVLCLWWSHTCIPSVCPNFVRGSTLGTLVSRLYDWSTCVCAKLLYVNSRCLSISIIMAIIMVVVLVIAVVPFGLGGSLSCCCLNVYGIWPGCHSGLCLAYGPYRLMAGPPGLSLCRMAIPCCTKNGGTQS